MSNRDDFSQKNKEILAKRVGYRCSNPLCKRITVGANSDPNKTTNIGVAAHIRAASPGGPRFDESMTSEERKSVLNGIWLCYDCSVLVDKDVKTYSVDLLTKWKNDAELEAYKVVNKNQCIDEGSAKGAKLIFNGQELLELIKVADGYNFEFEDPCTDYNDKVGGFFGLVKELIDFSECYENPKDELNIITEFNDIILDLASQELLVFAGLQDFFIYDSKQTRIKLNGLRIFVVKNNSERIVKVKFEE